MVILTVGWSNILDPVFILLIIILGASLGSFFNVIIDRLPRNKSIILPKSHCTDCGKSLPFYLNVPILSYIILRGKCKYCGAKIHIHHLVVEIITPLIFIALFWRFYDTPLLFAKYIVLFAFLIPMYFIDLYHRLILDKLTIPLFIIGLGFSFIPDMDIKFLNAIMTGLGIMALMLVIAWLFEKIKKVDGMGGGDIKLLAAMGTFLGAINLSFVVLFASIIAVIALVINRNKDKYVPYGPFLAISTFLWLLFGNHFLDWYLGILMG